MCVRRLQFPTGYKSAKAKAGEAMDHKAAGNQAGQEIASERLQALDAAGLTFDYLIKLLKKELRAKTTERLKIRGAVNPDNIGKGRRIVATSGIIVRDKDGEYYTEGDTVIEWDEVDWGTRQRARIDLHKLRGDYPSEKQDLNLNGTINVITGVPRDFDNEDPLP